MLPKTWRMEPLEPSMFTKLRSEEPGGVAMADARVENRRCADKLELRVIVVWRTRARRRHHAWIRGRRTRWEIIARIGLMYATSDWIKLLMAICFGHPS